MSDDLKVVGFPKPEVPPEEMVRRQRLEAERLARLSPGEWQLWIDNSAAQLGMPRAPLEASVKAIIAQNEKEAREHKAEAEHERRRTEKAAERQRHKPGRSNKSSRLSPSCRSGNRKRVSTVLRDVWTKTPRRCARSSRCPPVRRPPKASSCGRKWSRRRRCCRS